MRVLVSHDTLRSNVTNTASKSSTLNTVFNKYGVISYWQVYPGTKTINADKIYHITFSGHADSFKNALDSTQFFSEIKLYVINEDSILAECSTTYSINDPYQMTNTDGSTWTASNYELGLMDMYCAWTVTEGDSNVIIGIIDTEFDTNHVELNKKIISIKDYIPTKPKDYHGTNVSGAALAKVNNATGRAGIGNKIRGIGYRTNTAYISSALWQAYLDGCKVANLSWHNIFTDSAVVSEMTKGGMTIVIAAGNHENSIYHSQIANIPGVILVTSHDSEGKVGTSGHSKNEFVDLAAPGVGVYTTNGSDANLYKISTGTSIAAPLVAGVVGLMYSINPCIKPSQVEEILKTTCKPVADSASWIGRYGAGRIDAYQALLATQALNTETTITSHTTWNSDTIIYGTIIIDSGRTLTIQSSKIQFGCRSKIIVKKSGKLELDDAYLTTVLPQQKWKGIEMVSDKFSPPTPTYQPTVTIKNNSIIENAKTGIANYSWSNHAYGGGIILAENSMFRNCRRAVELNDYPIHSYTYSHLSKCKFDNMVFIINKREVLLSDDPSGPMSYPLVFSSWNTKSGILIQNSKFILDIDNTDIATNMRGYAVNLSESGGVLKNNTFIGFKVGAYLNGITGTPMRTVKVYENTLKYNISDILAAGTVYSDIKRNVIDSMFLPFDYYPYQSGIYLDYSKGAYVGCDNFISFDTTSGSKNNGIGIISSSGLNNPNIIKGNRFKDVKIGVQTQYDNSNLDILCNGFDHIKTALNINPQYADLTQHLEDQGNGCLPTTNYRAGNTFTDVETAIFASANMAPWNYYYMDYGAYVPVNTTSPKVILKKCGTKEDENKLCDDMTACISLHILEPEGSLDSLLTEFGSLVSLGKRNDIKTGMLFGRIIRTYNDIDNESGLTSFLESDQSMISQKMLIPLYINQNRYSDVDTIINNLAISQTEKTAYQNYYGLLSTLKQQNRTYRQLTLPERLVLENIASDSIELSAYASSWLEQVYGTPWLHPVHRNDSLVTGYINYRTTSGKSLVTNLGDAYPNPSKAQVTIEAWISDTDTKEGAKIVIRKISGEIVNEIPLKSGSNIISQSVINLQPGLYIYSLYIGNQHHKTKKLTIIK